MSFKGFPQFMVARMRRIGGAVSRVWPDASLALSRPALAGYILLTARLAQVVTIVLLLFMLFLAPRIIDNTTGAVFHPDKSKKLLGLVKTSHENPMKTVADPLLLTVFWSASVGYILLLFWFDIPKGLKRANERAAHLAEVAVNIDDPRRSMTLFKRAISLATDPQVISIIETQVRVGMTRAAETDVVDIPQTDSAAETKIAGPATAEPGQAVSPHKMPATGGGLIGRYTLGQRLGKGAMGEVYAGWDNVLDRKVAVKQLAVVFAHEDEFAARFRREAKAMARLSHPNVVQVYDFIEDGGRLWMVLEFVGGGDLASYLNEKGTLSVSDAVGIVLAVASGLAYTHSQGIVHRDLKPSNILLTDDLTPKISDFGIARLTQSGGLTQTGAVMGSPPYMSPEQCMGEMLDSRTDIYSLGITLYELLCGKVPFAGDTASVMSRHITEPPQPLSRILDWIPAGLEQTVMKMLAKDPGERIPDMTTVHELLMPFKEDYLQIERSTYTQDSL